MQKFPEDSCRLVQERAQTVLSEWFIQN
jgi:hypothetical protein